MTKSAGPDLSKYSVLELYSSGMRFCGDYDEAAAVEHYLELHPHADRTMVEDELRRSLRANGAS